MTETITELAARQSEARKPFREKLQWQWQNFRIQLRTRRWVMWTVIVASILGAASSLLYLNRAFVAPRSVCECPMQVKPPVQGEPKVTVKTKTEKQNERRKDNK
jgi:hypothetical protein